MASINNLEVKAVKYYPDHEGAMIPYGNLYYKNKKVGGFKYDSWGGPMMYDHTHKTISEEEVSKALHGIVEEMGWHKFYDSTEILIEELIELKEMEREFKKAQKQGRILLVHHQDRYQDPFKELSTILPTSMYTIGEKASKEDIDRITKEIIEENGGRGAVTVYRTLDDFVL